MNCHAWGEKQPDNDKACDVAINKKWSGYCECSWGEMAMRKSCNKDLEHSNCNDACAALLTRCYCENLNGGKDKNGIICGNGSNDKQEGQCEDHEFCSGPITYELGVPRSRKKSALCTSKCYCEHENGGAGKNGILCGQGGNYDQRVMYCKADEKCTGPTVHQLRTNYESGFSFSKRTLLCTKNSK